jgi:uncharacterized membrane protein YhaH (DUF805 family)
MKCACGVENIFGSKVCKACGASLTRADSQASSPAPSAPAPMSTSVSAPISAPVSAPAPAALVESSAAPAPAQAWQDVQPQTNTDAAGQGESQTDADSSELTFIPYTGNAQFNHFVRGLRLALDFKGRTGRPDFWYFTLFQVLILIVLRVVSHSLADLALLVMLVPTVAIWIRRLHDTSRSGFWLLAGLVPLLNLVLIYFAAQAGKPEDNAWGPAVVARD